jgi:PAS domain S-box-containing protein
MASLSIDIPTTLLLLFLGDLASVLVLVFSRSLRDAPSASYYIAGKLLQASAWVLLAGRGFIPDLLSVQVGNSLLFLGFSAELYALGTVDGPDRRYLVRSLFLVLAGILAFLAVAAGQSPNIRIVAASGTTILLFGNLSARLLSRRRGSRLRLVMALGSILFCLLLLFRIAAAIAAGREFSLMTPAVAQTLAFLPLYLFMVMGAVCYVLLLKEMDDQRLRESEAKYRTLVERASEAIVIVRDGIILFANRRLGEILGQLPEALTGTELWPHVWHEDLGLLKSRHRARMAGEGLPDTYDVRLLSADGKPAWMSISATLVTWEGKPAVLALFTDIAAHKRQEERITRLLGEKEILLKEVNHRVRNNLTVAMGLITMHADEGPARPAEEILLDARNRLQSMVQLYGRLHDAGRIGDMPVRDYLPRLVEEIAAVFPREPAVAFDLDIDDSVLDVGTLSKLGIITNEIVTNAMKHAFHGVASPRIALSVRRNGKGIRYECGDNGGGLPPGVDADSSEGFGIRLVAMLADQLRADMAVEREGGTRYVIEFKPAAT